MTASARIVELIAAKSRIRLSCEARVGDEVVIDGEAFMFVPKRQS